MVKMLGFEALVLLTLVGLLFTACSQKAAPGPVISPKENSSVEKKQATGPAQWENLVVEAKKEGKLMIYSSQLGPIIRSTGDAFEKKFGIGVDFLIGRGEELTQRIQMEKGAGLHVADLIIAGGTTLLTTMKPLGLLGKVEPLLVLPEVTDPGAWITGAVPFVDKDRTTLTMVASYQRYVMVNTEFVKEGEFTSYKALVNPKWKGKMSFYDPTLTGSGNAFLTFLAMDAWGLDETKEFMRQLVKQEPAMTRDRRLSVEWVARGKYPIGIAPSRDVAVEFMKLGAPVVFAKAAEGGKIGTSGGGLGMPVTVPHPKATTVFLNWLLSREGHNKFIRIYGQPGTRRDAPREGIPSDLFPEPGEKAYPEKEDAILFQGEMVKIAREIFAPLTRQ